MPFKGRAEETPKMLQRFYQNYKLFKREILDDVEKTTQYEWHCRSRRIFVLHSVAIAGTSIPANVRNVRAILAQKMYVEASQYAPEMDPWRGTHRVDSKWSEGYYRRLERLKRHPAMPRRDGDLFYDLIHEVGSEYGISSLTRHHFTTMSWLWAP
ncbi:Uu.00g051960.m01.CDS01 [Anthostomella pinea]|uniref:Uu.00g051960.m01.CDS01 n=1 Tax=Anthostomella pinea TaxID=933095 RepID=A0AAI8VW64_9PEZI|nr:Uu.00g051960.m01.CDS01 [Anthostomella pinea]